MINVLVCDDNKEFLLSLKKEIDKIILSDKYGDFEYKISCFSSSESALRFCEKTGLDIAFLDIDMPNVNGFELAKAIHSHNAEALIIFVTSYDNYVYSSLRYRPFRFIRKSHMNIELSEALQSALDEILFENKFLDLGSKYFNERILISDIVYFESKRNYAETVCKYGKKYMYRSTLSDLENNLKGFGFIRVHAAYLVNMRYIVRIDKSSVELPGGVKINISRRLYPQAYKAYSEYLRR